MKIALIFLFFVYVLLYIQKINKPTKIINNKMAKAKSSSETKFVSKSTKSCDRHAKSNESKNKNSKNYKKAYRGQGR